MNRRFEDKEKIIGLTEILKTEISGILNWCIVGLLRFKERGKFEEYDFVKKLVKELEDKPKKKEAPKVKEKSAAKGSSKLVLVGQDKSALEIKKLKVQKPSKAAKSVKTHKAHKTHKTSKGRKGVGT